MYVNHIKLYNSNTGYQKQIGYDTYDDRMWLRTKNNSTWTSWKEVWNSGDFAKADVTKGVTAHGWGNHADAGYVTTTILNIILQVLYLRLEITPILLQ